MFLKKALQSEKRYDTPKSLFNLNILFSLIYIQFPTFFITSSIKFYYYLMEALLSLISKCDTCAEKLQFGPRPIVSAHTKSKIVVIGQAPGSIVHKSGIPWDDKSGQNLRIWMGIDKEIFYNKEMIALMPMGFCYPGKGKSGDLPPIKECAPLWHKKILNKMTDVQLILLIGSFAQQYYLGNKAEKTLTETVRNYNKYLPEYSVLPHPSPRNNIWQAKNEWFKREVIPDLQNLVQSILKINKT